MPTPEQNEDREKYFEVFPARCRWCGGSGSIAIDPGSSTRYRCTDCGGTGKSSLKEAA